MIGIIGAGRAWGDNLRRGSIPFLKWQRRWFDSGAAPTTFWLKCLDKVIGG